MRVDDGQLADAIHADKSETILAIVGVASKVHVISAQKGNRNSSIINITAEPRTQQQHHPHIIRATAQCNHHNRSATAT